MSPTGNKNKIEEAKDAISHFLLLNSARFVRLKNSVSSDKSSSLSLHPDKIYAVTRQGWTINSDGGGTPVFFVVELSGWFDANLFTDVNIINPN